MGGLPVEMITMLGSSLLGGHDVNLGAKHHS